MAVWGPEAPPREAMPAHQVPVEAAVEEPSPERWADLLIVPLVAGGAIYGLISLFPLVSPFLQRHFGPLPAADILLYGSMAALYLGMLLVTALLLMSRGASLARLYFGRGAGLWTLAALPSGILLALCAMGVLSLLPEDMQQELMERSAALEPDTLGAAIAMFAIAALLAPVAEEVYFRGTMLRLFARRLSPALAALASAVVFSLSHGHLFPSPGAAGLVLTAILIVLGLVLARFARGGGGLRAPFLLHASYNATLMLPGVYMLLVATP